MDTNKVLKELVKVAVKQQKIINKLAQQIRLNPQHAVEFDDSGGSDVIQSVQAILSTLPSGKGAVVTKAKINPESNTMDIGLKVKDFNLHPGRDLRLALANKPLQTASGETVTAPDVSMIDIISETA